MSAPAAAPTKAKTVIPPEPPTPSIDDLRATHQAAADAKEIAYAQVESAERRLNDCRRVLRQSLDQPSASPVAILEARASEPSITQEVHTARLAAHRAAEAEAVARAALRSAVEGELHAKMKAAATQLAARLLAAQPAADALADAIGDAQSQLGPLSVDPTLNWTSLQSATKDRPSFLADWLNMMKEYGLLGELDSI